MVAFRRWKREFLSKMKNKKNVSKMKNKKNQKKRHGHELPTKFKRIVKRPVKISKPTRTTRKTGTSQIATPLELEIFATQNRLRTNPRSFLPYLQSQLNSFQGNVRVEHGERINTNEGPSAWREAIRVISKAETKPPLSWNDGLALGARDHCKDSVVSHTGSDGSSPF